jgi:hypothetical protein
MRWVRSACPKELGSDPIYVKCRTFNELQEDLCDIFDNFGMKFNFSFNVK